MVNSFEFKYYKLDIWYTAVVYDLHMLTIAIRKENSF